jgi:Transposase IS4
MFIGLYILNGLNPSPDLNMKFKSQVEDPIQGNDFVTNNFKPNAVKKHKWFRAFFCVQNPKQPVPDRKVNPLHKVSSFLKWMQQVFLSAWVPAKDLAGNEQTIGFQGQHADKLRITYKAEGDGFQCDALCDSGYTIGFYFHNMPPPGGYVRMGWSPLHARMLSLFDLLKEEYHCVWMDNLYISAKFARGCLNHIRKVLIAGVVRKDGRGVPNCVLQQEVMNKHELRNVRGTTKAAVLKGDPDCKDLLALSFYDAKPV